MTHPWVFEAREDYVRPDTGALIPWHFWIHNGVFGWNIQSFADALKVFLWASYNYPKGYKE